MERLRFVPVSHTGNDSESIEEAEAVASIVEAVERRATWTNKKEETAPLTLDDI